MIIDWVTWCASYVGGAWVLQKVYVSLPYVVGTNTASAPFTLRELPRKNEDPICSTQSSAMK